MLELPFIELKITFIKRIKALFMGYKCIRMCITTNLNDIANMHLLVTYALHLLWNECTKVTTEIQTCA